MLGSFPSDRYAYLPLPPFIIIPHRSRLCINSHSRLVFIHLDQLISRIPPLLHHLFYHSSLSLHSCFMLTIYHTFHDLMTQNSYLGLFLSFRCPTIVSVSPSRAHLSYSFSDRSFKSSDPLYSMWL